MVAIPHTPIAYVPLLLRKLYESKVLPKDKYDQSIVLNSLIKQLEKLRINHSLLEWTKYWRG